MSDAVPAHTTAEDRLLGSSSLGLILDMSDLPQSQRVISSEVIRRLCVGPEAKTVDPSGIQIKNAVIRGELDLSFSVVPHPLTFVETTFQETPILEGCRIPSLAIVGSELPGLEANGIDVQFSVSLYSTQCKLVDLKRAKIGRDLACHSAVLVNPGGDALIGDFLDVGGSLYLTEASVVGRLSLRRAKVGGDLDCYGAQLENEDGDALFADFLDVSGSVYFEDCRSRGRLSLRRANVGSDLDCYGARLANRGGDALFAESADIKGGAYLVACSTVGGVSLRRAKCGGDLDLTSASLTNEEGDALLAENADISGDVRLWDGFRAVGRVSLSGKVGGDLACVSARLQNEGDDAFFAENLNIEGTLGLRDTELRGGVSLFGSRASSLADDLGQGSLGSWDDASPLRLEGFAYRRFSRGTNLDPRDRFRWLHHTAEFEAGAWQQLADAFRTHGLEARATQAAIAMNDDRLHRGGLPLYRRAERRIARIVLGYGYKPWLAILWSLLIVGIFALIAWAFPSSLVPAEESVHGTPHAFIYAVDTFLPIIDFGESSRWEAIGWVRSAYWIVIGLGWALSAVFAAWLTRIVQVY